MIFTMDNIVKTLTHQAVKIRAFSVFLFTVFLLSTVNGKPTPNVNKNMVSAMLVYNNL